MLGNDVAAGAFEQSPLFVGEDVGGVAGLGFEPEQALVAREDVVALPDAAYVRWTDLDAGESKLVGDELRSLGGVLEAEVEDGGLDLGTDAVGMGAARPALLLDEAGDTGGLEGALDLVERVAVIAHELACPGDVAEFLGQLQQRELALGNLLGSGHLGCPGVTGRCGNHQSTEGPGARPETSVSGADCRGNTQLIQSVPLAALPYPR